MARDPNRPDRVRDRTLLRMQVLVGAAAALQTACAPNKPTDPAPGGDDGAPREDGGEGFSSGYMVVDPMPPPSRCGNEVAEKVTGRSILRPSEKGNDIVMTLRSNDGSKVKVGADGVQIQGSGGAPAVVKEVGNDVEIAFLYDGKTTNVYVDLPVVCAEDEGRMSATIVIDPDRQVPSTELATSLRGGYGY